MLFPLPDLVDCRRYDMLRRAHRKQEPTNCRHRRPISVAECDAIFYFRTAWVTSRKRRAQWICLHSPSDRRRVDINQFFVSNRLFSKRVPEEQWALCVPRKNTQTHAKHTVIVIYQQIIFFIAFAFQNTFRALFAFRKNKFTLDGCRAWTVEKVLTERNRRRLCELLHRIVRVTVHEQAKIEK